jgi:hypothetical protein
MKKGISIFLLLFMLGGVVLLSCDESLPPYNPPPSLLRVAFDVDDGMHARHVVCNSAFRQWDPGAVTLRIDVVNAFDETLQGPAGNVTGEIEIWKKDDRSFRRTIPIAGVFDPGHTQNGILTLDPGDTLHVIADWHHNDQQNRRLWRVFPERPYFTTIAARARLKPFDAAPELFTPEIEFTVTYDIDVDVPVCGVQ